MKTTTKTTDRYRISAKHLGVLALPDFCARCFWLQMRLGWKMPFQFFPGIFSSLDSYCKRITAAHVAAQGRLPAWLPQFGLPITAPHWSRFCWRDAASGMLLTGAPDEMLRSTNQTLAIIDYKVAKHTTGQDELLPIYRVQLNGYAWLAERLGMGRTEFLGLVYYEPQTDLNDLADFVHADGFTLRFAGDVVPVELQLDTIPQLLAQAREIIDQPEPPATGAVDCQDCALLGKLLAVVPQEAGSAV